MPAITRHEHRSRRPAFEQDPKETFGNIKPKFYLLYNKFPPRLEVTIAAEGSVPTLL